MISSAVSLYYWRSLTWYLGTGLYRVYYRKNYGKAVRFHRNNAMRTGRCDLDGLAGMLGWIVHCVFCGQVDLICQCSGRFNDASRCRRVASCILVFLGTSLSRLTGLNRPPGQQAIRNLDDLLSWFHPPWLDTPHLMDRRSAPDLNYAGRVIVLYCWKYRSTNRE